MGAWPKSVPDYKWPAYLCSPGKAPGRLALAGVFHVAYALGLLRGLLRRCARDRALVIRTDGLGDALLFEPALESLARALSPREIHLWAPRLVCELFAHCPAIRRMHIVPRGFKAGNLLYFRSFAWRARLGFMLGSWKFDMVIYMSESPEPLGNWLFVTARAQQRWLNSGDTINQFDWQRERTHERAARIIESRPGNAHELLRNQYLADQWGGEKNLRPPKIYLTETMTRRAEAQVDAWRSAARKVGGGEIVGVVAAGSIAINTYPRDRWAAALKMLWDQQRAMPVLLGGPGDTAALDGLATALDRARTPCMRLTKPLALLDMAALVGKLDGLFSVDTGLAHLAVTQGVPTIVLVAGGNPGRFFPWPNAPHHAALTVPTPCAGCNNRCTLDEPICLTQIEPAKIVAEYERLKGHQGTVEVFVAPIADKIRQVAG